MMLQLITNTDPSLIFSLMLLHCLIGLLTAIVADNKGYSFALWLLIGSIGGTIALIVSIISPNLHKEK